MKNRTPLSEAAYDVARSFRGLIDVLRRLARGERVRAEARHLILFGLLVGMAAGHVAVMLEWFRG